MENLNNTGGMGDPLRDGDIVGAPGPSDDSPVIRPEAPRDISTTEGIDDPAGPVVDAAPWNTQEGGASDMGTYAGGTSNDDFLTGPSGDGDGLPPALTRPL